MVSEYLTSRGIEVCRGCNSNNLISVLDLGQQPVANSLSVSQDELPKAYPLELMSCLTCGLGQVGELLVPGDIFNDYPYLSSMSTTWINHAQNFANEQSEFISTESSSFVLEIASNDGYLLKEFNKLGIRTIGVEPAENVAEIARGFGVETICAFFGSALATKIKVELGYPKLIVANNVMAHVPDLQDFIAGLALLCGPETLISIENPTMLNIIKDGQFDTIYHEHYSYLSAHAVSQIVRNFGLELFKVEKLTTHGGSNRYWISRTGAQSVDENLKAIILQELSDGLINPVKHNSFRNSVRNTMDEFKAWLSSHRSDRIIGYGASAKGTTFFNYANVNPSQISAVVDASHEKQNKFIPGAQIPIYSPDSIPELSPDHILVTPWNIIDEINSWIVSNFDANYGIWTAVPNMKRHH